MTQKQLVLRHLLGGVSITPLDALRLFGCFRLSAVIYDLKQLGFPIESKTVNYNNKHFAEYYILQNNLFDATNLWRNLNDKENQ